MNRHYQALCRHKSPAVGQPVGEPFTVRHILGGDPAQAIKGFAAMLEAEGYHVIANSVVELYAEVDWTKPVYDLDEFGSLTGIRGSTLSAKKGSGEIPWNSAVGGCPRRVVLKYMEDGLNLSGMNIVTRLDTK